MVAMTLERIMSFFGGNVYHEFESCAEYLKILLLLSYITYEKVETKTNAETHPNVCRWYDEARRGNELMGYLQKDVLQTFGNLQLVYRSEPDKDYDGIS